MASPVLIGRVSDDLSSTSRTNLDNSSIMRACQNLPAQRPGRIVRLLYGLIAAGSAPEPPVNARPAAAVLWGDQGPMRERRVGLGRYFPAALSDKFGRASGEDAEDFEVIPAHGFAVLVCTVSVGGYAQPSGHDLDSHSCGAARYLNALSLRATVASHGPLQPLLRLGAYIMRGACQALRELARGFATGPLTGSPGHS